MASFSLFASSASPSSPAPWPTPTSTLAPLATRPATDAVGGILNGASGAAGGLDISKIVGGVTGAAGGAGGPLGAVLGIVESLLNVILGSSDPSEESPAELETPLALSPESLEAELKTPLALSPESLRRPWNPRKRRRHRRQRRRQRQDTVSVCLQSDNLRAPSRCTFLSRLGLLTYCMSAFLRRPFAFPLKTMRRSTSDFNSEKILEMLARGFLSSASAMSVTSM
ncbi:hypothetical protein L596_015965 [Steinernema carpocapsae]|uniref:Uncharacterized protein n=1 Tax=Steinernema carpocapsae TaxID=34508 RepID=A0A4U5NGQ2_STECR|nr:hypothetical protein L596_015965 [Steinernema carpocapsae]